MINNKKFNLPQSLEIREARFEILEIISKFVESNLNLL